MSSVLRWGIVSAGRISHDFACALCSLPKNEHKIVAVASRNIESAKKFAQKFNIELTHTYESLAKDPNIDIAYIGSINSEHYDLCKLMLSYGKHVLCEKPFALNAKQTNEILELAKSKNLYIQEAIWTRFFPAFRKAEELWKSGAIGDVRVVTATFAKPGLRKERMRSLEMGGGSLLDLGIYALQWPLRVFCEMPSKIVANGTVTDSGVDEGISVYLQFSNGRFAHVLSHANTSLPATLCIGGTKGSIIIPDRMWCPDRIVVNGEVIEFDLPSNAPGLPTLEFAESAGLQYEAASVRECILAGKLENDMMSHIVTRELAEIMDSCRKQLGVKFACD